MRRNSLVVWSYSKQPSGHQVLAYRNVMRCTWAVRKTARPKNGGRLGTQIRAKKSEARQSGFTFFGPDLGSQDGPRFGAVSGKSIRKEHHYYLATALIRRNVKIEIQNMISIRWKLSGWKTCFREPENPIHPRIFALSVHRRWARPHMKHKHWHDCNNETQLLTADQYATAAHHMFSATVTSGKNPCHCNKPQEAQQKLKT